MATETDQTAGQLDEATVLRVLEMIQGYGRDQDAQKARDEVEGLHSLATMHYTRSEAASQIGDRLVAMYRASLGIEEA